MVLIGITLNLQIVWGNTGILTMLSLPIHQNLMSCIYLCLETQYGIVSLISFLHNQLLVYRNTTGLYIDFVTCNFSKFICSNSFSVEYLGFLDVRLCHLQTDNFPCSFLSQMLFMYVCVSWLIALARTSNIILNRNSESRHLALFLTLQKKLLALHC